MSSYPKAYDGHRALTLCTTNLIIISAKIQYTFTWAEKTRYLPLIYPIILMFIFYI